VPLPLIFGGFAALAGLSAWMVLQIRQAQPRKSASSVWWLVLASTRPCG